ncbi:hypothetical protein QRO11_05755 [Paracidovorax citrulli]|uniref:hypothetical protein n=1 Tax=Paracidovorax citrulli TaxID=80869 RepID=UPI000A6FDD7F|nr:hypothetical protein [Paracidovorax citrulli]WIY35842.1 hypothetical protein QRO11_05755 [Paracidovorax citrulli]
MLNFLSIPSTLNIAAHATNIDTSLFSFTVNADLRIEDDREKRIFLYNSNGTLDPTVSIEYFKRENSTTSLNIESTCSKEFNQLIKDGTRGISSIKIEKSENSGKYIYTIKISASNKSNIKATYYCNANIGVYIAVLSPQDKDIVENIHSQIMGTLNFKD